MHQASMWVYIMHQYGSMLVHPQVKDVHQASVLFNGVYQASKLLNNGSILCIMHPYGSMLCIHGSMMCIRMHQASVWLTAAYQTYLYGTVLLNAVQALNYAPMLCIRHHNRAQTRSSWFNIARCGESMTQAVHHASIWLNATWFITQAEQTQGVRQLIAKQPCLWNGGDGNQVTAKVLPTGWPAWQST